MQRVISIALLHCSDEIRNIIFDVLHLQDENVNLNLQMFLHIRPLDPSSFTTAYCKNIGLIKALKQLIYGRLWVRLSVVRSPLTALVVVQDA